MNAIRMSTPARPQHYAQPSIQDDYQRALSLSIARCIAIAVILTTIGLTEWYGSALYGNPLVSSQEDFPARDGVPSLQYFPAQYVNQATYLDRHVETF